MSTVAFALVIASAFAHASWNFLLKRSEHKTTFLWSAGGVAVVVMVVPAIVFAFIDEPGWTGVAFGAGSGVIHGVYGLSLSRGYQLGELSSVYPVSRGMGPALVPFFAVILLGENVSPVAGVGIALIVFGIYAIHIDHRLWRDVTHPIRALTGPATRIAFLTGALIACYSLWDKAALDYLSPVTLNGFSMAGHFLVLTPVVLAAGTAAVNTEWRMRGGSIVAAGLLVPLAYTLVLAAMTTSQVSYIAPVREVGIVIGAFLGVVFLGEGYGVTRVLGSALIVAGVIGIAIG
ncbi:MAG TPA: DMT family transporter [Dehalococcoidia bacterium]|nr:DMT family transporter [Dehalococcoidia bacterium]